MMTNKHSVLDFEDPGKIDNELLDMPGFVGKLTNHTLAVSPRPNNVTAFCGALAMQAFLSGSHYRDVRGLHTNLYLATLAPSSMGKECVEIAKRMYMDELAYRESEVKTPIIIGETDEATAKINAKTVARDTWQGR